MEIDYRAAINAISDVVQNRPAPIREFDQIYMKTGDMVAMSIFMAERFADLDLVFIGDGDGIALSIAHLVQEKVLERGPKSMLILDFDERIVNSIVRFADHYKLEGQIGAVLYNVIDPLPKTVIGCKGAFYTNPPWGASNDGESVLAFLERGMEAVTPGGLGAVVIADDASLPWTQDVLHRTQEHALRTGFIVGEMVPTWHLYHLDDAPDLKSCAMLLRGVRVESMPTRSEPLPHERRRNFYGRDNPLRHRYVREKKTLNYGRAPEDTYFLEALET